MIPKNTESLRLAGPAVTGESIDMAWGGKVECGWARF
jgi:hypothetical protein